MPMHQYQKINELSALQIYCFSIHASVQYLGVRKSAFPVRTTGDIDLATLREGEVVFISSPFLFWLRTFLHGQWLSTASHVYMYLKWLHALLQYFLNSLLLGIPKGMRWINNNICWQVLTQYCQHLRDWIIELFRKCAQEAKHSIWAVLRQSFLVADVEHIMLYLLILNKCQATIKIYLKYSQKVLKVPVLKSLENYFLWTVRYGNFSNQYCDLQ